MIKACHITSALFSIALIALGSSSFAQVVDVSGCRAIEDSLKRFDCYERLGADDTSANQEGTERTPVPQERSVAPAVAQPARSAAPAPKADPVIAESRELDEFGRPSEADNAQLVKRNNGKTELVDTIASIDMLLPTLALITLESGQKWKQMNNKRYPMKVGDEVRIYPSIFGDAYRLSATRMSGHIQVERVD